MHAGAQIEPVDYVGQGGLPQWRRDVNERFDMQKPRARIGGADRILSG